jgi:hypothetical protein
MECRRIIRFLRIGWTGLFAVVCAILIALWVRSYWRWENVAWGITTQQGILVGSQSGAAVLQYVAGATGGLLKWQVQSLSVRDTTRPPIGGIEESVAGFHIHGSWRSYFMVCVPYWFLVPLSVAVAAAPWSKWSRRFSLRTLLIATTFVAVLLGLIAFAIR